jgi:predicted RNA-binding Zn ribbon-like protein
MLKLESGEWAPLQDDQRELVDRALRARGAAGVGRGGLKYALLAEAETDVRGHPWRAGVLCADDAGDALVYLSEGQLQHFRRLAGRADVTPADLDSFLRAHGKAISAGSPAVSQDTLLHRARRLQLAYEAGYEMPRRAVQLLASGDLRRYQSSCFALSCGTAAVTEKLLCQRVPCNIGGRDHFSKEEMTAAFGWDRAFYEQYYLERGHLAPQVAVCCSTPMFDDLGNERVVNVVNLVGLALDSRTQVDAQYLKKLGRRAARAYALEHFRQLWSFMVTAARRKHLRRVEYAEVGGQAFGELLEELTGLTYAELFGATFPGERSAEGLDVTKLGWVPHQILGRTQEDLDGVLLVNAWDPLALVGNGNARDHSLDGWFGRSTAMGLLCWPLTNPHLQIE